MNLPINEQTKIYWTSEDFNSLDTATNVRELFSIAQHIIERMPKPFGQVCGPIATGGLGDIESNLHAFNKTIQTLQDQGIVVFDQMPFEIPIQNMKKHLKPGEYFGDVLEYFYKPLFEMGVIGTMYFMPNWQTSKGAMWEHEEAKRLEIKIVYL